MMKLKVSVLWFFLLAALVLAVQSAAAVGHMGGHVGGGGKSKGGGSSRIGKYRSSHSTGVKSSCCCRESDCQDPEPNHEDERQPEETPKYITRTPEPTRPLSDAEVVGNIMAFIAFIGMCYAFCDCSDSKYYRNTSLKMVQVAVKNCSHEIQCDFSQTARRLTPLDGKLMPLKDALYMLSETKSRVLYHSDSCFSATSSVDVIKSEDWKLRFEQICKEQLGKSDGRFVSVDRLFDEFVVVTFLVAVTGAHKLPEIKCLADLRTAFSRLGSPRDDVKAVKVFWTPPNGRTKMLEDELVEEFPQLRRLEDEPLGLTL